MLAVTGVIGLVAVGFSLAGIANILELLISNLWSISIVALTIILGIYFTVLAYREEITEEQAFLAAGFLALLLLLGIGLGFILDDATTTYSAELGVHVEQSSVDIRDDPTLTQLEVQNIEETSVGIFGGGQQACLINCGDWQAEVTVTCDGTEYGTQTAEGFGGTVEVLEFGNLPSDAQCEATAEPLGNLEGSTQTGSFTTG